MSDGPRDAERLFGRRACATSVSNVHTPSDDASGLFWRSTSLRLAALLLIQEVERLHEHEKGTSECAVCEAMEILRHAVRRGALA